MAKCNHNEAIDYEEDLDCIDFNNYKGMFFQDDPGLEYQDEKTGAHFEHGDMCKRLLKLKKSIPEPVEVEASEDDDVCADTNEDVSDDNRRNKINESGIAVKALQAMQLFTQDKDSRNAAQALPQQGYGSTVAHKKDNGLRNQFCSQLDKREQPKIKPAHCPESFSRSKSMDKQRANNGTIKETVVKNVAKNTNSKGNSCDYNVRKQAFVELYVMHLFSIF